jgi:hypothetical protein
MARRAVIKSIGSIRRVRSRRRIRRIGGVIVRRGRGNGPTVAAIEEEVAVEIVAVMKVAA